MTVRTRSAARPSPHGLGAATVLVVLFAGSGCGGAGSSPSNSLVFDDGDSVIRLGFAVSEYRLLGEILLFGLLEGDEGCPSREESVSDAEAGTVGTIWYQGGCTTAGGVTFEGSLTNTYDNTLTPPESRFDASGWEVVARSEDFQLLEFDGSWEREGSWPLREDWVAAQHMRLIGSKRGYLTGDNFPEGLSGSYQWGGDWRGNPELHWFNFNGEVTSRGSLQASVSIQDEVEDGCLSPATEEGTMRLEAAGSIATLDFADS
ncbi:MAG: hypothetical protein VX498_10640, partial [Myxococcota bacterium]|nr:hypothetical protein [Myxococcota bacterium]